MFLAAVPKRLLECDPFQCSVDASGAAPFIRSITIQTLWDARGAMNIINETIIIVRWGYEYH